MNDYQGTWFLVLYIIMGLQERRSLRRMNDYQGEMNILNGFTAANARQKRGEQGGTTGRRRGRGEGRKGEGKC